MWRIWRHFQRSHTVIRSLWWWIPHLRRLTWCGPSSTERILWYTRRRNLSAGMGRPLEECWSMADGLTGKRLGNIPGFPKQIPAIMGSLLQRRRRKRHLRLMSGRYSLGIREPHSRPSMPFLLLQGLETLSLRVERHVENAQKIVEYLSGHPKVEAVHHPSLKGEPTHTLYKKYFPKGGGSIFTFEIKGGEREARAFYRQSADLLPAGQCGGRQEPGHPSGFHHSQPADR